MPAEIMISRTDHTPDGLRELAFKDRFRDCRHRLRAIALVIEDETPRAEIAARAGADTQTLCDWVKRYDAKGIEGLRDSARPGRPPKLDGERTAEVAAWLDAGSDPDAGEPSRWTAGCIRERIAERFEVSCTVEDARRLMRRLGFRLMSPRPVHPRADPQAQEEFRANFSRLVKDTAPPPAGKRSVEA